MTTAAKAQPIKDPRETVASTRVKTAEITNKLMNHVTLGWCNEFLSPALTLSEFVPLLEGVFGRFLNRKFHASDKSDLDLIKEFVELCEMTMATKTNPEPAYVFCDYCWDPGTHTVGEMDLCMKSREAEEEKIKKCEEEAWLKKEMQHKKWEEVERRKHHEALEHKKRVQQQRDVEVRVKCTYCTSGELHTQREVIRCLEAYVKGQKKEML